MMPPCCNQVFLAIAVFLGDGLYHFTKISIISLWAIRGDLGGKKKELPVAATPASPATPEKVSLPLPPRGTSPAVLPSLSSMTGRRSCCSLPTMQQPSPVHLRRPIIRLAEAGR